MPDHPHAEVPPGEEKCDFCSSTEIVCAYPSRDHITDAEFDKGERGGRVTIAGIFSGDWAACAPCRDMIERGDREGLAKRSTDSVPLPDDVKELLGAQLATEIRKVHDNFWMNRDGEAVPVEEARRG